MNRIHGSCVAVGGKGVIFRGPPGSGKSDMALRMIDEGAKLVADDQILLTVRGDHVIADAPPTIAGLLEARGLGVLQLENLPEAQIFLIVDLVSGETVERMPQNSSIAFEGITLPLTRINPFEPSSTAKIRLALRVAAGELDIER